MIKRSNAQRAILLAVTLAFFLSIFVNTAYSCNNVMTAKSLEADNPPSNPFYFPQCVYTIITLDVYELQDNYTAIAIDYVMFSLFEHYIEYQLEYDVTLNNGTRIQDNISGLEHLYWFNQFEKPIIKPYAIDSHAMLIKDVKEGEMYGRILLHGNVLLQEYMKIY